MSRTVLHPNVYSGKYKLIVDSLDFMKKSNVKECMELLRPKNVTSMIGLQCEFCMMHMKSYLNPWHNSNKKIENGAGLRMMKKY